MKGNHNIIAVVVFFVNVVINMSKIQNERKSQQNLNKIKIFFVVINMSKIQNERKSQLLHQLNPPSSGCN